MDFISEDVRNNVIELIKLLTRSEDVSDATLDRSLRLLRQADPGHGDYTSAIKQRVRQSILAKTVTGTNGPSLVAAFEKECDNMRRFNSHLLQPFLSIMEPLSYSLATVNQFGSRINSVKETDSATYRVPENQTKSSSRHSSSAPKQSELPQMSYAIAGGLMPIVPPYHTSGVDVNSPEAQSAWISNEVEIKLLKDLIFIFQGIGGRYIKYDPHSEQYVIDPSLKLQLPVKDTVLCLCELGWLYTKVSTYIQTCEKAQVSRGLAVQAFSFALQEELHDYYRLLAVLEQELARKVTAQDTPSLPNSADREGEGEGDSSRWVGSVDARGASGLTLLRLRAWIQEPMDRMCMMARLVDSASPLTGGALASRLHAHGKHGDPATRQLVMRVMDCVCAPLFSFITRWVLHGELHDSCKEFFVGCKTSSSQAGGIGNNTNMWLDTYYMRPSMLPTFLSRALAERALVIGKSINFIRLCVHKCPKSKSMKMRVKGQRAKGKGLLLPGMARPNVADALGLGRDSEGELRDIEGVEMEDAGRERDAEREEDGGDGAISSKEGSSTDMEDEDSDVDDSDDITVMGSSVAYAEVEASIHALRYGCGEEAQGNGADQGNEGDSGLKLMELVTKISAATDSRLLKLMQKRFHLSTHLLALKKFMLLGQGDFVTCLMDSVGPELKKRANVLYRHNLTGVLEGALRSSNAQYEPSFVLDRIGVRLLEPSPGDSGWEVFSLDYVVDVPLNAVVHSEAMSRYRTAFHMLWRLKRVEWSLSGSWKQLMSFSHAKGEEPLPALKSVLHRCTLMRGRMMHVVNNLSAFLMFEVMESAWLTLQDAVHRACCLDDVIRAHDAYLGEIMDRALLAPQHERINMQVQHMLQAILRFCSLEETLVVDAMAALARRRAARMDMEERTRQGGWGVINDRLLEDPPGTFDGVPGYVITRIDECAKDFGSQFDGLMSVLGEEGELAEDILRYLTFRLDFNDYHALSKQNR